MKCPQCGHWNRDSFPRCFHCGTPLNHSAGEQSTWQESMRQEKPQKIYIRVDDEGRSSAAVDERDILAREMNNLQERKERGKVRQRSLREESAKQGLAPSGRTVENITRRGSLYSSAQKTTYVSDEYSDEATPARMGATPVTPERRAYDFDDYDNTPSNDELLYTQQRRSRRAGTALPVRQVRVTRGFGMRRLIKIVAALLILLSLLATAYFGLYKPLVLDRQQPPLQELVEISPSIFDERPAHTIKIPGEEGAVIYIKELRKSYTVTGGYAIVEVADHTWYEDVPSITDDVITATLTPYLKTNAGEQVPMDQITFEVDVPLSPLTLITPDTGYDEVSTAIYNIQFRVEKNSSVYINGEDYSDLVNTQDGLISYNANIQPIGDNVFTIVTQCQYYRENSTTVTIHRAVQDIPLDLSTTLSNRSLSQTMKITATTLPGAEITIESDYVNLDTSTLNSTGEFSFEAVFTKIGTNTITIKASYPGKETSVVHYNVYYLPESRIYTAKAWPLNTAWDYSDLLSNISLRVSNSQIYECIGEVVEIISESPQLAILEMGNEETSRQALLENQSTDTWVVGNRYRIYADVYGLYNGMPRLIGRYTYRPLD